LHAKGINEHLKFTSAFHLLQHEHKPLFCSIDQDFPFAFIAIFGSNQNTFSTKRIRRAILKGKANWSRNIQRM